MISPRQLFLKQPFASNVQNFIVQDQFQAALAYALADMATSSAISADQLSGAKLFIAHLNVIGERIEEEKSVELPTLSQPDPQQMQRLKEQQKKGNK
jgi:hypothetical protein